MKKYSKRKALIFNVEKILDKKKIDGKIYYYIEWEGYPLEDATWEPLKNLESCLGLVKAFEEKRDNKSIDITNCKTINNKKIKPNNTEIIHEKNGKSKTSPKISFSEDFFNQGSFIEGDQAKCVVFAKRDNNKKLLCAVEWEKRKDGTERKPTFYSNEEIKKYAPKILADFYESKLKFLK